MNIDPNIIMAIIALVSVITPSITTWQNNNFRLKLKELDNRQKELEKDKWYKREIFENYVCSLSKTILNQNAENLSELGKYYALSYLYAPENLKAKMSDCQILMKNWDFTKAKPIVDEIITDISALIRSQYK